MCSIKSSCPALDIAQNLTSKEHIQLTPYRFNCSSLAVWYSHNADPNFNSTPVTIEVWSTSASDTGGGVGSQTVELKYIDENMLEQTETLEMDGTTVVSPTQSGYRVNSIRTLTSGSSNGNVGVIYAGHSSKAYVLNLMLTGENRCRSAMWACGAKSLYLKDMSCSNGGSSGVFVSIRVHDILNNHDYVHSTFHIPTGNTSGNASVDLGYLKIPAGHEFYCAVNGSGAQLNGVINAVLV